jgi:hypothetical protein
MGHNDDVHSRGLSTQDLIDVEPHGEHAEDVQHGDVAADAPRDDRDDNLTDRNDAEARGEHSAEAAPDEGLAEVPSEEEVADAHGDEPVAEVAASAEKPSTHLFAAQEVEGFRGNWREIQIAFVDDPKRAVTEADELVAAVIQSLAATFAEHKSELESQWREGEAATEDLRLALRQYRSFFNQLLDS